MFCTINWWLLWRWSRAKKYFNNIWLRVIVFVRPRGKFVLKHNWRYTSKPWISLIYYPASRCLNKWKIQNKSPIHAGTTQNWLKGVASSLGTHLNKNHENTLQNISTRRQVSHVRLLFHVTHEAWLGLSPVLTTSQLGFADSNTEKC